MIGGLPTEGEVPRGGVVHRQLALGLLEREVVERCEEQVGSGLRLRDVEQGLDQDVVDLGALAEGSVERVASGVLRGEQGLPQRSDLLVP